MDLEENEGRGTSQQNIYTKTTLAKPILSFLMKIIVSFYLNCSLILVQLQSNWLIYSLPFFSFSHTIYIHFLKIQVQFLMTKLITNTFISLNISYWFYLIKERTIRIKHEVGKSTLYVPSLSWKFYNPKKTLEIVNHVTICVCVICVYTHTHTHTISYIHIIVCQNPKSIYTIVVPLSKLFGFLKTKLSWGRACRRC